MLSAGLVVEAGEDGLSDRIRLISTGHQLLAGGLVWVRYAMSAAG